MLKEEKVWARPVNRKKHYVPIDKEGKVDTRNRKNQQPLAMGAELDFFLQALFPALNRKKREALARMGGMGNLSQRIYVRYTPYYLSLQRHGLDTTLVYTLNGEGHEMGQVNYLTIKESQKLKEQQDASRKENGKR